MFVWSTMPILHEKRTASSSRQNTTSKKFPALAVKMMSEQTNERTIERTNNVTPTATTKEKKKKIKKMNGIEIETEYTKRNRNPYIFCFNFRQGKNLIVLLKYDIALNVDNVELVQKCICKQNANNNHNLDDMEAKWGFLCICRKELTMYALWMWLYWLALRRGEPISCDI